MDYVFQDINDILGVLPEGRTKPWGTRQAVLAAKSVIDTLFIVINADDYYGKEGLRAVHDYLVNGGKSCMAGFVNRFISYISCKRVLCCNHIGNVRFIKQENT